MARNRFLVMAAFGLWSCSTDVDLSNRPYFNDGVNVLEAQVVNGFTGAAIQGAELSVRVGAQVLDAEEEGGALVVHGIPSGTYEINATATGFAPFRARLTFASTGFLDGPEDYVFVFRYILMYPTGITGALTANAYNPDGLPASGATVVAEVTDLSSFVSFPGGTTLSPNSGLVDTVLVAQTNAAGTATFAGESLIYGATYQIDVFGGLDQDGSYGGSPGGQSVTVGEDDQDVHFFLTHQSQEVIALYANNEGTPQPVTSTLDVTFPFAIELCSVAADHDWTNLAGNTDGDTVLAAPAATNPVTVTLLDSDTTLRLGYITGTGNNAEDPQDDLVVQFSGIEVKPKGSGDWNCALLTNVELRNSGDDVDMAITVRDVP